MGKKIIYLSCAVIVILHIILIKFMHLGHGYFDFEELPAFGALIGFIGALFIVIFAKSLSKIVTKREDYYD
jgi:nitrate/nitrite transporter NarK